MEFGEGGGDEEGSARKKCRSRQRGLGVECGTGGGDGEESARRKGL